MTSRVSAAFQSALFLLMIGCTSQDYSPNRIYGISDAQVYSLGKTLGFDVQARGLSNYYFSNRNKEFGLTAHNDIDRFHNGEPLADEPIRIFYHSNLLEIPMAQGVTMEELEDKIRDFIEEK